MAIDVSGMKGPLGELFDQCSGEQGQERFEEFKLWLKKVKPDLLKQVTTLTVYGPKRFVVADYFKVGTTDGVKIARLNDTFKQVFLGKVEGYAEDLRYVEEVNLDVYELVGTSSDILILAEIGQRAETTLAHAWQLLAGQPNGEPNGPLLAKAYNVFYVPGTDGNLWAVGMILQSNGWDISAEPLCRWYGVGAGNRVFARA